MDKNAEMIIARLNSCGYEAFAVGGAVRDMIMNKTPDDWDITTNALPEETKSVFSDFSVIETGIKHGTVTVVVESKPYEITTYRTESAYTDSRHPDSVAFVRDLRSDLARRDFTVNAIAYSAVTGYVDVYGGIEDINNKIIRAVGEPKKRFTEDALRILRALRFASVLGFEIEKITSNAIFELADTLKLVSPERIFSELKKLLTGKNAVKIVAEYSSVLAAVIPIVDVSELKKAPNDFCMRLSCLCKENVVDALAFLRADNRTKHICKTLVDSKPIPKEKVAVKKYISALGREYADLVINYRSALYNEDTDGVARSLVDSEICLSISELAVDGNDLLSIGIEQKSIGKTLSSLLNAVLEEKIENKKESLLIAAKNIDNLQ